MFPDDYFQVFIIYLIIASILWIPPLIIPQWKNLVRRLNQIEIERKKQISFLLFGITLIVILITLVLITFFNSNLLRLEFENKTQESEYFHYFAGFTFFIMPVSLGLFGATSYIYNVQKPKAGDFFLLLFVFSALAIAGSFYHDLLWCGTVTNWYTERVEGGYDFDLWLQIVHLTNRDYQLLGISQATMAGFLIILAAILTCRFNQLSENKITWQKALLISILSFFIIIFYGLFLFIIDIGWYFDLNVTFHALYFGFFLIVLLFYFLGKSFVSDSTINKTKSINEEKVSNNLDK